MKKSGVKEKAELLRNWREFLGMTQRELAEKVGRKQRSIGHWEAGNFDYSPVWVAGQLGMTEAEFLAGPSVYEPKTEVPISSDDKIHIPSLLVRLYMLSEIRKSIKNSPVEGFAAPVITIDNASDIIVVRVDISSGIDAKRVYVDLCNAPGDDDFVLVWDGRRNRADFISHSKVRPHHILLGLVAFM